MKHRYSHFGLLVLLLLFPCCGQARPRLYQGAFASKTLMIEVAATPETRRLGLMHRRSLPPDRGMLFVFPEERRLAFWMRNTHIPLSIAYLDARLRVVSIHPLQPYNEESVDSAAPVKYALEVNRGWFRRAGVRPGARLLPGAALRRLLDKGVRE